MISPATHVQALVNASAPRPIPTNILLIRLTAFPLVLMTFASAGATHTDFHVNFQYFSNEQISPFSRTEQSTRRTCILSLALVILGPPSWRSSLVPGVLRFRSGMALARCAGVRSSMLVGRARSTSAIVELRGAECIEPLAAQLS